MSKLNDTTSLLAFLRSRKSASAKSLTVPGPRAEQLDEMLTLAVRVPDHGKLAPWRFISFSGEARGHIGVAFSKRWAELNPGHGADSLAFQAGLFERAPMVVVVVSTAHAHRKIPLWEQQLSAAAVCFNLVLAAQAFGYDAQWQTDWIAYDEVAKSAMGLAPGETVAGVVYFGTSAVPLEDRPRPDAASLHTRWSQ